MRADATGLAHYLEHMLFKGTGHIEKSLNITLGELASKLDQFKDKKQPIITCCASGMRSAGAAKILSAKGYTNVVNGGGWSSLESKLKK